ncbi:MAG: type II secretion system F family protein [Candidatus Eremiobacteraeota bacterium]|nr:type II secretion system F family protein [Candidatus Eremiobacteraeota bacterium]
MPTIVFVIAGAFALSAFLFALSLIPSKSEVSIRLEELETVRWDGTSGSRAQAFEKVFNEKQRGKLQQQLLEAGWYQVTPAKMGARIVSGFCFGLSFGLATCYYFGAWDPMYLAGVFMVSVCGAQLPKTQLKNAVKARKIAIQRALPDWLDMLATTVQAGLAFNAALGYAQEVAVGPLGEEVKAVLSEIRLGRSRADALKSMANRVKQEQLTTTCTAIIQAERLGSNLAHVLEELSDETRNRRMMRAEEIANIMPTKMVLPMALFMLPALFVMIFGGVAAEYMSK